MNRLCYLGLCLAWVALAAGFARGQDVTALFVMSADGKDVRRVAQVPGFKKNSYPRWSHDGQRLAFDAYDGPNSAKRIFVVNADGSGLRELGPHGAVPDWSPDDKQLAFQHYGEGGEHGGSWVQNVDGKGRDWFLDGYSPRWSADGSRLAYTDWHSLLVRDLVDGSEQSLLEGEWNGILAGFDWSPDGKRIAFVGKDWNNKREVWVVTTESEYRATKVLTGGELNGQVAWAPDGKRLAVSLNESIQIVDPDDPKPQRIAGQVGRNRDPAWSRDGKWIAFSSDRKSP